MCRMLATSKFCAVVPGVLPAATSVVFCSLRLVHQALPATWLHVCPDACHRPDAPSASAVGTGCCFQVLQLRSPLGEFRTDSCRRRLWQAGRGRSAARLPAGTDWRQYHRQIRDHCGLGLFHDPDPGGRHRASAGNPTELHRCPGEILN